MLKKTIKTILLSLLFIPSIIFSAPVTPQNGGDGIANNNANTEIRTAPMNFSGSASSAFSIDDLAKGSRPYPVKTTAQRNAIGSPESGLEIYNSDTKTLDYFDGSSWQKILITQNIQAGANVTVTDNGDGTVTISSSGGGALPAPAYGAYSVHNNSAPRPGTIAFIAVPVSSGFTSDQEACVTNSIQSIGGINTPISVNTCSETQFFEVDQSVSMQGINSTFRQYIYAIAIKRAGGAIETTNYQMPSTQNSDPANDHPTSMHGVVELAQGDGVFTQVYGAGSDQTAPTTYITSKISTIAGTSQPSLQDIYNNDPSYPSASVNLFSSAGSIQFNSGSEVAFGAGNSGIASTLGLRLLPSNGIESIEALQTDNPTSAIFTVVSTIRGSKPIPDMTTGQRDLISGSKPVALGIYNISLNTPQFWTTNNTWMSLINDTYPQTINGVKTFSSNIVGNLTGNASTATNGVVTTGSYADPAWITSLAASKISGLNPLALVGTDVSGSLTNNVQNITPNIRGLGIVNNFSPLVGAQTAVDFSSSISYGNYMNMGSFGPYIGIDSATNGLFITGNAYYDVTSSGFFRFNTGSSGAIRVNASGVQIQHMVTGPGFTAASLVTDFSDDGLGNLNFPNITASSLLAIDGSKNLIPASGTYSINAATATTATNASNVATTQTTTNATYFPLFVASSTNSNQPVNLGAQFNFNASTRFLTTLGLVANNGINGSNLTVQAGAANNSGVGGNTLVNGGGAGPSGNAGDLILTGGVAGTNGIGGNTRIRGGTAPSGTPGAVFFDQGNVNFASANQILIGGAAVNVLNLNSTTGTPNRADINLNRFDLANGFARFYFSTAGVPQWTNGLRSTSNNYVIFDEINSLAQLTMAQGPGATGTSTFAGIVNVSGQLNANAASPAAINVVNGGGISGKNSGGTLELWMYPRFTDNRTYMDIGSAGATFRQDAAGATWMSVDTSSNVTFPTGNILISTAGKTASVKSGTNGCIGTQALSGASTVVNTTCATTGDLIFFTITSPGGTPGQYSYAISNGVSFTITSTLGALDTSTVGWFDVKKP